MSSDIAVVPLPADAEGEWNDFVRATPDATFCHLSGWRRVLRQVFGHNSHYLMAQRGGEILGVLPLSEVKTALFGHALISTGFCVYGGIAASEPAAARALADAAAKLGEHLGVDYVELRQRRPVEGLDWTVKDSLYVAFERPIEADTEANLKAIPRKKRADVRKGLNNEALRVVADCPFEDFWQVYSESVRNHGTPIFGRHFYQAIADEFGEDVELSAVYRDGQPLSVVMTYYFRDLVMPYFGGASLEGRKAHAFDLMYYELMNRAAARGCRSYDFGRSKRGTGQYDYKTYWGFEPEPLPYAFHLVKAAALPELNPLNPKYRLMIETWRRLPLPLANLIGPMVARGLG